MMDMGDYTKDAKKIAEKSYDIVSKKIPGNSPKDMILKRAVIATGDFDMKDLIVFKNDPLKTAINVIKSECRAYCDVEMIKAGIKRYEVICVLSGEKEADIEEKKTRTSAGFYRIRDELKDSIILIGNAPSAAISVYEMVKDGLKPSLIVATPVGFVNAAESKELIRSLNIPSITTKGTRGGSTLAVAIFNGLIGLARE
ncbi:MAG: precorrin-8X methylmutase [Candidatus Methanolliviera sp. GoM_asphalt]|nr:MAG: precorrin-8X methylmutase [Candidatus Methanolliviera sp. GoM_asphalt]